MRKVLPRHCLLVLAEFGSFLEFSASTSSHAGIDFVIRYNQLLNNLKQYFTILGQYSLTVV